MIIGVIADTHGLVRPQAVTYLKGSDLIVHAGDIGAPAVIDELRQIAPVHAIRGNVDRGEWATHFPDTLRIEAAGRVLYLIHDINTLEADLSGVDVVICGHSHRPKAWHANDTLMFNPGSAGPRRFSLPISIGRLILNGRELRHELTELSPDRPTAGAAVL